MGHELDGNAGEAIRAFGGSEDFEELNGFPEKAWELDGNAGEALKAWGGIQGCRMISSIVEEKAAEMPSVREDSPSGGAGFRY